MSQTKCFECGVDLVGVGKPMEELLKSRFPVFCCQACADSFPDNGTKEFDLRLEQLSNKQ